MTPLMGKRRRTGGLGEAQPLPRLELLQLPQAPPTHPPAPWEPSLASISYTIMTVTTPSSRFLLPYLITSLQELGPSGKTMSSRKEKNVPSPFPLEQPRLSESFFLQGVERVREVSRVTIRRVPGPPRSPSCQNSRPAPFPGWPVHCSAPALGLGTLLISRIIVLIVVQPLSRI